MTIAKGTLDVEFDDQTYDERDGTKLARRRLRKVFHGDIQGESSGEFLLALGPDSSAAYVGLDRVDATIGERSGSFVLVHYATRESGNEQAKIVVLAKSAAADFRDLRGELAIAVGPDGEHTYAFEYELSE